jgi:hypothetical protein
VRYSRAVRGRDATLPLPLLLLLGGCYGPSVPAGAPCDPAAPSCPAGQSCVPAGGGYVCGQPDGADAAPSDALPDAPVLGHVRGASGWSARVFQDFSGRFKYVLNDFVDGDEMYDNQPDSMFVLEPPFAEALAVLAGRVVIELTGEKYAAHDFGAHAPNTAGVPDHLRGGTYVPALGSGGAALLLSSSSRNAGGDGTFRVTPAWAISSDRTTNNTRAILWDPAGLFDSVAAPEGYLGTSVGVVRRSTGSAGAPIIAGDTKTLHLSGANLLLTRQLATSVQLIEVATGTHAETILAERTMIELADGPAPAPHRAWAILDRAQLVLVRGDGTLETVAESTDAAYSWEAAAAAAPPHPLAGAGPTVYIVEGNRALDIDRVLAIEAAP